MMKKIDTDFTRPTKMIWVNYLRSTNRDVTFFSRDSRETESIAPKHRNNVSCNRTLPSAVIGQNSSVNYHK